MVSWASTRIRNDTEVKSVMDWTLILIKTSWIVIVAFLVGVVTRSYEYHKDEGKTTWISMVTVPLVIIISILGVYRINVPSSPPMLEQDEQDEKVERRIIVDDTGVGRSIELERGHRKKHPQTPAPIQGMQ